MATGSCFCNCEKGGETPEPRANSYAEARPTTERWTVYAAPRNPCSVASASRRVRSVSSRGRGIWAIMIGAGESMRSSRNSARSSGSVGADGLNSIAEMSSTCRRRAVAGFAAGPFSGKIAASLGIVWRNSRDRSLRGGARCGRFARRAIANPTRHPSKAMPAASTGCSGKSGLAV